jgi:hypothetical protein
LIVVDPVVVNPETDSKKDSVIPRLFWEKRNGSDEKIDNIIQLRVTKRKVLFISIISFLPLVIRIKVTPIKLVKAALIIKPSQLLLLSNRSMEVGTSIVKAKPVRKTPRIDKTGLKSSVIIFIF